MRRRGRRNMDDVRPRAIEHSIEVRVPSRHAKADRGLSREIRAAVAHRRDRREPAALRGVQKGVCDLTTSHERDLKLDILMMCSRPWQWRNGDGSTGASHGQTGWLLPGNRCPSINSRRCPGTRFPRRLLQQGRKRGDLCVL